MGGLDLSDLGLDADDVSDETPGLRKPGLRPVATGPHHDPDAVTLRRMALKVTEPSLQRIVRDLGVEQTIECLRRAVHQIWGQRPDLMPTGALLMTARGEESAPEALAILLRLRFPRTRARRILTLTSHHAAAFLDAHLSWQAGLADEGVAYEEMNRRALRGEFDVTGPLGSRFDLRTMSFREPA